MENTRTLPVDGSATLPKIVLASKSPRRRVLLDALGLPFRVDAADAAEDHPDASRVASVVASNALRKAQAVQPRLASDEIALGADTLVVVNGQVLGKPQSPAQATAMLELLSGRTHEVFTGIAFVGLGKTATAHARSSITFHPLRHEEIARYVATREPHDKAGAYAVQGVGMLFIDRIEGSYSNVMGLPLELFLLELERFTGIDRYRWFA